MNYEKVYDELMYSAKKRGEPHGYYEKHHIVPRSLGGDNSKENIVKLTAKEHLVAHKLLVKFKEGEDKRKMQRAFFFMFYSNNPERKYSTTDLAKAREQYSESLKGRPSWNKGRTLILTKETRELLSKNAYHALEYVDNSGFVVAKDSTTGNRIRVTKEEFYNNDNLVGVAYGNQIPERAPVSFKEIFSEEERKNKFGRGGPANGASRKKSLERYGQMSDEEFGEWCKGKSSRGIKRALTFRKQYLSGGS